MGDFVTAFARGQSAARPGADAAVRARVQRAMEHPSSQSGAPASPHMIILALAKWLRRW